MPVPEVASPTYTTLSRVQARLKAILTPALDRPFWLRAELSSADERNGALFAELVETDERGALVARMRCSIWSADLRRIRTRFARAGLELSLEPGNTVGLQCAVSFHPVHGLSLRGLDMDPAFVLGELELRRRRILANLERDGLLGQNAQRRVPLLPNRILLITSSNGAALHDFVRALDGRCAIRILLADSIMQGPRTEETVLRALELAERLPVDLVVLIRGGGSKLDLGSLDSEVLARKIAGLSKPVWTGIGHETDTSVLDAVAAQAFRTPTAVAEALALRFERVQTRLLDAAARLRAAIDAAQSTQRARVQRAQVGLVGGARKLLALRSAELAREGQRMQRNVGRRVSEAKAQSAARAHRLQRTYQLRIGSASSRLATIEQQLPQAAARSLRNRTQTLVTARVRLSPQRVQAQLERQRQQLTDHARTLRTQALAKLAGLRAGLDQQRPRLQRVLGLRVQPSAARIALLDMRVRTAGRARLLRAQEALARATSQLSVQRIQARCERERQTLEARDRILRAHDPRRALERGFSLTYGPSGRLVRSVRDVEVGQAITTHLADGEVQSQVQRATEESHE